MARAKRGEPAPRKGAAGVIFDLAAAGAFLAASAFLSRSAPAALGAGASRSAPPALAKREVGRGREATAPGQIPARGWIDILKRTFKEFNDDHVTLVAAGITFYTLLAFFPGLGAFVALYGLFADVSDARDQLNALSIVMPPDMLGFVGEQMMRVATAHDGGLSFAFAGGLALSLWSASGAVKALILGLNIAYEEEEKRGFVRVAAISLVFTVGLLAFVILAVAAILSAPAAAAFLGDEAEFVVGLARWPILAAALVFGVTLLYRYGPSRERSRWRWVSWGAAGVTAAWIASSVGFSFYLANFGDYDKTYGPLGALFGFMMWTYVSAMIVLLGAELNAEIEHQTARDTTTGPELPLGARGATMADTVGAAQR